MFKSVVSHVGNQKYAIGEVRMVVITTRGTYLNVSGNAKAPRTLFLEMTEEKKPRLMVLDAKAIVNVGDQFTLSEISQNLPESLGLIQEIMHEEEYMLTLDRVNFK